MHFIAHFGQNHFLKIINNLIPFDHFLSHLSKNAIYGIARGVSLDLDIALKVKILEDWCLGKSLPQLDKDSFSIRS